jgi:hypothetical protein
MAAALGAPHPGQHGAQELLQPICTGFQLAGIHLSRVYTAGFEKLRYT